MVARPLHALVQRPAASAEDDFSSGSGTDEFDMNVDDDGDDDMDDEFDFDLEGGGDGELPDVNYLADASTSASGILAAAGAEVAFPEGESASDGIELRPDQRASIEVATEGIDAKTFYEILLLPRGADEKGIKRAYYKLSKEFHPDKYYRKNLGHYKAKLEMIFNRTAEAYRVLSDPTQRAEYDKVVLGLEQAATKKAATVESDEDGGTHVTFVPDALKARLAMKKGTSSGNAGTSTAAAGKKPPPVFMTKLQKDMAQRVLKAREHFALGQKAMEKGNHQEAATQFQLSLAMDPRNTKAKLLMNKALGQHRNGKAEELWKQAQDALSAQNQKAAADLMKRAVDCKPTRGRYYNEFGKFVMLNTLHQKDAIDHLKRAVDLEQNNVQYLTDLGTAYEELGMPSNAIRMFEKVLQLEPKNAVAARMMKKLK